MPETDAPPNLAPTAPHATALATTERRANRAAALGLTAFCVLHVAIESQVLRGEAAYDAAITALRALPGAAFVELALVAAPVLWACGLRLRDDRRRGAWPWRQRTLELAALATVLGQSYTGLTFGGDGLSPRPWYQERAARLSSTHFGLSVWAILAAVGGLVLLWQWQRELRTWLTPRAPATLARWLPAALSLAAAGPLGAALLWLTGGPLWTPHRHEAAPAQDPRCAELPSEADASKVRRPLKPSLDAPPR